MPENENNAVSDIAADEKKDIWTQTWEQLKQGVQDFMTSEKFADYLKCVSSFYRYSVNNTILIAMQDPEATMVGSFTFWKSKGRYVQKGQRGIKIIAPAPVKQKVEIEKTDPNTGEILVDASGNPQKEQVEKTIPRFKVVTVFDVRQTAGEPLPELGIHELEGGVENFSDFMIAIQTVSPVPIRFAEIEGGAKGYYHLANKEIVIQSGMSESQTMKTCIHEVSHAYLHDRDVMKAKGIVKDAQTREVEAESVAFCVLNAFKIDSSAYSFPYIGSWSSGKDLKVLKASMDTIRLMSGELIEKLNEQLETLAQLEKYVSRATAEKGEASFGQVVQKSLVADAQPNRIALKPEADQAFASDMPIGGYMDDARESVLGRLLANKEALKQKYDRNKSMKTHDRAHSKGGQVIG